MQKTDGLSTQVIHADRDDNPTRAISTPIFQTSTYRWDDPAYGAEVTRNSEPPQFYARWGHPNQRQLESIVASIEGAERALATSSGISAALLAVLPFVSQGDHIILGATVYGETENLFRSLLPRFGVSCSQAQGSSLEEFERCYRPETKVVLAESPANPSMELLDIALLAAWAHSHGVRLVMDNTFATPVNTQPLRLGADMVFHSATKYLSGHSDVLAGVLAGSHEEVEKAWVHQRMMGPNLNPFDAWLVARGLRTLPLRMARHNQNGQILAEYLARHPRVEEIRYPGLPSHPQHELARRQMKGFGGMLSLSLKGGDAASRRFVSSLRLFTLATSLGGIESLIQYPTVLVPKLDGLKGEDSASGIRVSVGCEDPEDLLADLAQALDF